MFKLSVKLITVRMTPVGDAVVQCYHEEAESVVTWRIEIYVDSWIEVEQLS